MKTFKSAICTSTENNLKENSITSNKSGSRSSSKEFNKSLKNWEIENKEITNFENAISKRPRKRGRRGGKKKNKLPVLTCYICNKEFESDIALEEHNSFWHKNILTTSTTLPPPAPILHHQSGFSSFQEYSNITKNPFSSDINKTITKNENIINTNIKSTIQKTSFKCDKCPQIFNNELLLKTHKFIHQGIKPFKCNVCQATFANTQILRDHITKHLGKPNKIQGKQPSLLPLSSSPSSSTPIPGLSMPIKPFKCNVCNKNFNSNDGLRSHSRAVHDISKFTFTH